MKLSIPQLTKIANEFLQQEYNMKLNIPIVINSRLKSTLGAFVRVYKSNKLTDVYIELSKKILVYGHENSIIDTLKHELVHYALWSLEKPHRDGDLYFENELKRLGIGSTGVISIGLRYIGRCCNCNKEQVSSTKSHYSSGKYLSGCCKAKLELIGEEIHDGVNEPIRNYYIAK